MDITVKTRFLKDTPRKLRLTASVIRGMKVANAAATLAFVSKAAANPLRKSVVSAMAILKEKGLDEEKFSIKMVRSDQGPRLKRRIMKSRGQSSMVQKRMTHLTLTISDEITTKESKRRSTTQMDADKAKKGKTSADITTQIIADQRPSASENQRLNQRNNISASNQSKE